MGTPPVDIKLKEGLPPKPETMLRLFCEKFFKNKLAVAGSVILLVIIFSAIFAPVIAPYAPERHDFLGRLQPRRAQRVIGPQTFGRYSFTRVPHGARVSLLVGFVSVVGAITIGTVVGAVAGYFKGFVDSLLMRFVDVVLSIPDIFLLITLVTIFKPGIDKLILIFALTGWTTTARLIRSEFLSLRTREFVLAARTIGTKNHVIIFSHILPNCIGPIIVSATLKVGTVILAESTLSYLGFGIQPPTASWGNMLQDAQNFSIMVQAWWYPLFPGLFILITVLCFNFLGDGLRDSFDPKRI